MSLRLTNFARPGSLDSHAPPIRSVRN